MFSGEEYRITSVYIDSKDQEDKLKQPRDEVEVSWKLKGMEEMGEAVEKYFESETLYWKWSCKKLLLQKRESKIFKSQTPAQIAKVAAH